MRMADYTAKLAGDEQPETTIRQKNTHGDSKNGSTKSLPRGVMSGLSANLRLYKLGRWTSWPSEAPVVGGRKMKRPTRLAAVADIPKMAPKGAKGAKEARGAQRSPREHWGEFVGRARVASCELWCSCSVLVGYISAQFS